MLRVSAKMQPMLAGFARQDGGAAEAIEYVGDVGARVGGVGAGRCKSRENCARRWLTSRVERALVSATDAVSVETFFFSVVAERGIGDGAGGIEKDVVVFRSIAKCSGARKDDGAA